MIILWHEKMMSSLCNCDLCDIAAISATSLQYLQSLRSLQYLRPLQPLRSLQSLLKRNLKSTTVQILEPKSVGPSQHPDKRALHFGLLILVIPESCGSILNHIARRVDNALLSSENFSWEGKTRCAFDCNT